MKKPSFLHGIIIALILAVITSAIFFVLMPVLGAGLVLRALIALMSLCYVLYLLRASRIRTGRLTTVAAWLVISAVIWFWTPSIFAYLMLHTGIIWLVRSFYFHSSIITSLADLGLCLLAVVAAVWASAQTNSLFLGVWCFFLVQSFFVMMPVNWARKVDRNIAPIETDQFQAAYRAAELALRKISSI